MTEISWVVAYFVSGMVIGVGIALYHVAESRNKGDDLKLGDLGQLCAFALVTLFLWPVVLLTALFEWVRENWKLGKDTVILRGSRSAKTYRALISDDRT